MNDPVASVAPFCDPGPDAEYEEVLAALTVPDAEPDTGGLTRRRFLQGMVATAGAAAITSKEFAEQAAALAPLGVTDGVVVIVQLGGGNDGLNTVIPVMNPAYNLLRPTLGAAAGSRLLGSTGFSIHAALPRLAARYAAGTVAVINGVGNPAKDQSHFSSMATWMAGTASTSRATGWLGRYLDGIADSDLGMRSASIGAPPPLTLLGARAKTASVGGPEPPYGSNNGADWEIPTYYTIAASGGTTGLGPLADEILAVESRMIANGRAIRPAAYDHALPAGRIVPDLDTAARLINLDLGVRVVSVAAHGSFDTHVNQLLNHRTLLADLDAGIEQFFQVLNPSFAGRVVLMTFSEFGRRSYENGSGGTDHGTAAPVLLIGDRVRGGVGGTMPSLTSLDANGNLAVTVDFRSVYATILQTWLRANPTTVLGATYPTLPLFRAGPG